LKITLKNLTSFTIFSHYLAIEKLLHFQFFLVLISAFWRVKKRADPDSQLFFSREQKKQDEAKIIWGVNFLK
jgi:hypothetical protein